MMKINLGIAIVCMVNHTAISSAQQLPKEWTNHSNSGISAMNESFFGMYQTKNQSSDSHCPASSHLSHHSVKNFK